jgi:hypothetical protein
MSDEQVLAEADNPKLSVIVGAVVVVLVVIVAICIGVDQFYKFAVRDEINAKVLATQSPQLRDLRAQEKHDLHSFQYINKEQGVVRIPVDVAVALTLADWEKRPAGTTPIEGAQGAAPSPAPAPK